MFTTVTHQIVLFFVIPTMSDDFTFVINPFRVIFCHKIIGSMRSKLLEE